jgi:hypothetical protein
VVTNESEISSAPGQRDALLRLVNLGYIKNVDFISWKSAINSVSGFEKILDSVSARSYDALFIWSPRNFPDTKEQFERLSDAIGHRTVIYWEGDPWTKTGIKKFFPQMFWWAQLSTCVFSVAGDPQLGHLRNFAPRVLLIPHTYCHVQFRNEEISEPPSTPEVPSLVMVANQVASLPFIYGVPGSGTRFALANALKFKYGARFELHGTNWPKWLNSGKLNYRDQALTVRKHSFSVNWDNFPLHTSYASDRLPISLLAGRVHLTSYHPGKNYYGTPDVGLRVSNSFTSFLAEVELLYNSDPKILYHQGLEGYKWARNRLSHRQSAQFMISKICDRVPKLNMFPWNEL